MKHDSVFHKSSTQGAFTDDVSIGRRNVASNTCPQEFVINRADSLVLIKLASGLMRLLDGYMFAVYGTTGKVVVPTVVECFRHFTSLVGVDGRVKSAPL